MPNNALKSNCLAHTELQESEDKLKILILDNELSTLYALRLLLETLGHSVSAFSSSTQAIENFGHNLFDLALIDFRLPGNLDGIKVINKLKSIDSNINCFLVTGENSIETQDQNIKIIHKPLTNEKLKRILSCKQTKVRGLSTDVV